MEHPTHAILRAHKRGAFGPRGWWRASDHRSLISSTALPPDVADARWWRQDWQRLQLAAAIVLESKEAHWVVIGLVFLDLAIVITELSLSGFYPSHCTSIHIPHAVHTAETALSWTSIGILIIFTGELLAKLLVFGTRYFVHSLWHMLDAVVIVASLVLELVLKGVSAEIASLLIFFRLWRIVRVMHGVAEAIEIHHEQEMEHAKEGGKELKAQLLACSAEREALRARLEAALAAAAAAGLELPSAAAAAGDDEPVATPACAARKAGGAEAAAPASPKHSSGGSCGRGGTESGSGGGRVSREQSSGSSLGRDLLK